MKKFNVQGSETVFYDIEVEAETAQEAREKVFNGEIAIPEASDSSNFQIDNIEEII